VLLSTGMSIVACGDVLLDPANYYDLRSNGTWFDWLGPAKDELRHRFEFAVPGLNFRASVMFTVSDLRCYRVWQEAVADSPSWHYFAFTVVRSGW